MFTLNLTQVRLAMLTHTSSNIPISSPTNKPDKRENYDKSESCGYLGHRKNFKQENLLATKRMKVSIPFVLRRLSNCARKPI